MTKTDTDISTALSRASREMAYAAQAVSDHFSVTDSERQSIADRRYLKAILIRAKEAMEPIAERIATGEQAGDGEHLLKAYRALQQGVFRRLAEATIFDDSDRRETSDLMI